MRPMAVITRRFLLTSLVALAACARPAVDPDAPVKILDGAPPKGTKDEIAALEAAIQSLGSEVDPEEAARAARVTYDHTYELAIAYRITDSAIIHNMKVNAGLKPRGLCKHWAEDMQKRLAAEDFQTLDLHRAIGARVSLDHSTTIISRKGDDMFAGIVVDPWREGGTLTWIRTADDIEWGWEPQVIVLDRAAREIGMELGNDTVVYSSVGLDRRCLDLTDPNSVSVPLSSPEGVAMCFASNDLSAVRIGDG